MHMMEKINRFIVTNRQTLAYGLGGFSTGILGTLFGMFNVMFFSRVVGLNNKFFYSGHIMYGIWNAVNDPAFGWLIDHTANKANRRLPVIKYGGPLWCFFFMWTWYPWSSDGDSYLAFGHFLFSMFCYDGFLTYVLLVKCALLADLCVESTERNKLNNFSAWFSFAGSSLAMTAYYTWDENNLSSFRAVAWIFSFIAGLGWYYSGKMMVMPSVAVNNNDSNNNVIEDEEEKSSLLANDSANNGITGTNNNNNVTTTNSNVEEFKKWLTFAKQLLKQVSKFFHYFPGKIVKMFPCLTDNSFIYIICYTSQKNFVAYVSMNWMMNFNVTLSRSFFIFLDKEVMKQ